MRDSPKGGTKYRCEYCFKGVYELHVPDEEKEGKGFDTRETCSNCGAVPAAVITAKFIQGFEPFFRRSWRGKLSRGYWANPATGQRDVMTDAEFQLLKDVPR